MKGNVSKVPLLGDIPLLGRLFRYDSRKRTKTNLLVFLRPVVLRDAASAWDVTASRYDYIGQRGQEAQLGSLAGLADVRQPALDELPARPGTPGVRRGPPSQDPGLLPGAAEEARQHEGVRPLRSLQAPQPDLPQAAPLDLRAARRRQQDDDTPGQGARQPSAVQLRDSRQR